MTGNKLRIAIISAHSCPVGNLGAKDTGGMSVYIRELTGELDRKGHLVDVYTRVHDPRDPQIISLGQNARLIHLKAGEDEAIHKLAVYSYLPDFACNVENFRKHEDRRYDLVFSHYWLSGWVGEYLQRWWHVPHMTMFHTLGAVKNAIGIGEDEPELRLQAEKELAQNCHRIIAPTRKEKTDLIRHYGAPPERIGVVPCGVNMGTFKPQDKGAVKQQLGLPDDNIILFAGRIEPLKGIDRLLKAFSCLQNEHRSRLIIIGGDIHSQQEIARLKKLSRELNIEGMVTFLGLVRYEQMPLFYSAADVCVIPSYYESFGLVALESLACGTPVVTTNVGDMNNIIRQGKTGYVVADNSPRQLANSIAQLLSRPDYDADKIPANRVSVSRFSWSNIADMIIGECRTVLSTNLISVT